VLGVHKDHVEALTEDVVERLPVHPRALHGHVRTTLLGQPLGKLKQVPRHGSVGSHLIQALATLAGLAVQVHQQSTLVHVYAGATSIDDIHGRPPSVVLRRTGEGRRGKHDSAPRALCK
jgi:hypothetical protein